jgi:hypothetical protein
MQDARHSAKRKLVRLHQVDELVDDVDLSLMVEADLNALQIEVVNTKQIPKPSSAYESYSTLRSTRYK